MINNLKNENKNLKNNSTLIENELATTLKNMNDVRLGSILDERVLRRAGPGNEQDDQKVRAALAA